MIQTQKSQSPFINGLRCRCPRCGKGRLFRSFLKIADKCESCALDFEFADSGDGPAIFIIFIVGFIVVSLALIVDILFHPPVVVLLIVLLPITLVLCLALMQPFKATMVALQFHHDAKEGRSD